MLQKCYMWQRFTEIQKSIHGICYNCVGMMTGEGLKMPVSESQKKAVRKYKDKTYDRIETFVPKGRKEAIKAHADAMGESLNGFIGRAIDETMGRDAVERAGQ